MNAVIGFFIEKFAKDYIEQEKKKSYNEGVTEGVYKGLKLAQEPEKGVFIPNLIGGNTHYLDSKGNLRMGFYMMQESNPDIKFTEAHAEQFGKEIADNIRGIEEMAHKYR